MLSAWQLIDADNLSPKWRSNAYAAADWAAPVTRAECVVPHFQPVGRYPGTEDPALEQLAYPITSLMPKQRGG